MFLPPFKGRYRVATSSWKIPIPKRVFGTAKLKETQQPAFQLEEVSFQIFYPCDTTLKKSKFGDSWLERLELPPNTEHFSP